MSSVWSWLGTPKVCLYDTFLGGLRQAMSFAPTLTHATQQFVPRGPFQVTFHAGTLNTGRKTGCGGSGQGCGQTRQGEQSRNPFGDYMRTVGTQAMTLDQVVPYETQTAGNMVQQQRNPSHSTHIKGTIIGMCISCAVFMFKTDKLPSRVCSGR